MKKKILIISNSFFGNNPRGIRARNISKYLKKDVELHILAFNYNLNTEIEKKFNIHKLEHSLLYKFLQKDIFYPKLKNTFRRKLITLISIFIRKFLFPDDLIVEKKIIIENTLNLHKKYNFDIIIGLAQPYTIYTIGEAIKNHDSSIKWVLDIGDPFYNNAIEQGTDPLKNKEFENSSLSHADLIILTNKYTKNNYVDNYPSVKNKIFGIIPQGVDIDNIKENEFNNIKNTKIKLIYAGIFYPKLRNPNEIFKAIANYKDEVIFDIYGAPNIYKNINNKISFKGRVSNEEIINAYQNSDILVFLDNAYGFQTSGKIYELLAIKKPILFIYENEDSPTKEFLVHYDFIIFTKNDHKEIIKNINLIIKNEKTFTYNFNINDISWEKRSIEYKKMLDLIC